MKPRPAPSAPAFATARAVRAARAAHAAYTLVELLVAATMSAVVLVATLTGVVALQKSYAATEEYATGLADQMRLLDYLALDLRRAVPVPATAKTPAGPGWTLDNDAQGLQITVPNYYHFNASDPQHLFPVANDPVYDPATGLVTYQDPAKSGVTTQKITYRFDHGAIVRADPWQPLAADGSGGYVATGPVTIASNMDSFPTVVPDAAAGTDGATLRYNVTFHSIFQPLATANGTNAITLHNVTFIRSKNLTH